jgi:GT2 family glycosyltransferase/tetratricopeptide (TPR) repeat protein/2-polyprenyl-3-methyl-5-hydroxy-6-metoxy-1,4-benzoquinol methylase
MAIARLCVIYDDRERPETTGGYCLRALRQLVNATHTRPDQADSLNPADFDLYLRVDDGMEYALPAALRPLAWWAIDTHLDFNRCLAQARGADLTFAAQRPGAEALRRAGVGGAAWLPLACDPAVHRPHDVPKRYDVCFVGNLFPGPRAELVELLRRHFPSHFAGRAYFDEMARTYSAARAAFNRSLRDDLNMRVFEALGCGALLATNELPPESGQAELFRDGAHLATYRCPEELLDKLRFYLARPEVLARVARAGHEEAVTRHTYRHRMTEILRVAERLPKATPASAPAALGRPAFDPGYFEFDRPELVAMVPGDARDVVDVGCGAGRLGAAIKARQECRVVGIEHNPAAAAAARSRLDLVVEGDAESLDWQFPAHSFDAVVCGDVLEHLRDPLAFLRRVRTWLRPSGSLVASLPNVRHHSVVRGLLGGDWTYEPAGLLDHTHLRFFTRREVEKLLFRAGFEVPRPAPIPGPGYAEWAAAGRPGEVSVGDLRVSPIDPAEAEEFYAYQWLAAAKPAEPCDYGLTSIVILSHNQLPLTRWCVDSIRLLTDEPYEVVLVDNGSTDGTPEYLRALAASDGRVKVVLNAENRGFPAGCNQGIAASRGSQVLLLNNDTVVTTGWLARMLRALHSSPSVGLVGPCSNRVSGEQRVPVTYSQGDLNGLDGFAWEWGRKHDRQAEETDRLVGFCLLIKRPVIEAVGVLDEGFGVGNFEDDDYCRRALRAGFHAVIARDAFVHHVGGATFAASGVDYDGLMRRNAERFRAKWGGGGQPPAELTSKSQKPPEPRPRAPEAPAFTLRRAEGGGLLLAPPACAVKISGCLIVRDNAKTIGACLESLRPWVDELVVVDTGSKDDTPRIAAELGARVSHFEWVDDFSAARNESVRHARGEWVFWMDSDDVIDEANGRALRELADGPHPANVLGYVVRVHCTGPDPGRRDDVTVVDHVKLFRNRPGLRFEHRIHEQIIPAIRRAGGDVAWTDLFVVHAGYDHSPEGQARKKERDLRILHQELSERPGHPFTLFNLGMTYADVGEPGRAAGYLEESLRNSAPGDSQRRKAYSLLAFCRAALNDLAGALRACEEGLAECPEDVELLFRFGVYLHAAGRLREAVTAYGRVLSPTGARYFTSLDRGVAGFKARANLAAVHADLGEWDRAESLLRDVTAEEPNYRPAWRGLGDLLVRRGGIDDATDLAKRLAANPQLAAEGHLLAGRVARVRGRNDEARRAWASSSSVDPTDPEPLGQLARLHFESGDDGGAEQALRALIDLTPADPSAHHNLGAVLLRTSRPGEAVVAFRRSLELRPGSVETRTCLGYALRATGDRVGAAAAWRAVLAADPEHREAAEALRQQG